MASVLESVKTETCFACGAEVPVDQLAECRVCGARYCDCKPTHKPICMCDVARLDKQNLLN